MASRQQSGTRGNVARYEALIRVSEALRAYHDRDELFRSLARELRPVVAFHFLGLALYDDRQQIVVPFVLEASGAAGPLPLLTTEDQMTYWVLQNGQPLVVRDVGTETRFAEEMVYLRQRGTQSACCLPLTTPQRNVGMLIAGSDEPDTYRDSDVAFLALVANQVALAIDDTRNFGALQDALLRERERARDLEASDELLRALSPVADIATAVPRISAIANRVLAHDRMTLSLHDGDGECELCAASGDPPAEPMRLSLRGSDRQGDHAFVVGDIAADRQLRIDPASVVKSALQAGFRSLAAIRLAAGDRWLGLQFWSRREDAFEAPQLAVARRIADHVALALSHQRLGEEIRRAGEAREKAAALERRVSALTAEVDTLGGHRRIVGQSQSWKAVLRQATQVAGTDTTVLLVGESGTGKEVIARFVHRASRRAGGPFVAINCAALPEQLLESELFGYERGAFTGAVQSRPGRLEQAAGGVLFLDEVSEMSPAAQAKLLRVLQEREFQRLGGTRTVRADVRVIAATNRNLRSRIETGEFREDLYYRLNVFEIVLPPLRERRDDILPLCEAFLQDIAGTLGRPPGGIAREARDSLLAYRWPGNIRELRNVLERAAILCDGGLITSEHLALHAVAAPVAAAAETSPAASGGDGTNLRVIERRAIEQALLDSKHNKSQAARILGLSRKQLYVRLRQHGLL